MEDIPSTFEIGESSHPTPPLPLTGEPMEVSVPTLVARTNTHEYRLDRIGEEVREMRDQTEQQRQNTENRVRTIENAVDDLKMSTTHMGIVQDMDWQAMFVLQERVITMEQRTRAAELLARMSTAIAGLAVIFGMYSHFFH
jgi:hypothetical protein